MVNVYLCLAHRGNFLYIGSVIEMTMGEDDFPDGVPVFRDSHRCNTCINENITNKVGISKYRVSGNPLDRHAQ